VIAVEECGLLSRVRIRYFASEDLDGIRTEACTSPMQDDSLMLLNDYSKDFVSSPSTILLVDDDPDIRSLTRTFLEHEGYRVFSSGDALRAMHIFSSVPQIDLLITDLYMPGRSGMELAFELKMLQAELPVLMISGGFVDGGQKMRLQQEGWRFLGKPFLLPELLSTVHLMLEPCEAERMRVS
jgi:two-component system, chemotaxis family, chemotaxis protein CheY